MSSNTKQSITIRDIAVKAKVSKSTVSRVLNNSTSVNEQKRAAVLTAMQQLEYKPNALARGLAGGQSMTIGVVTQNIGSPFYDYTTHGIISGLHGTNYFPLVVDGQWNAEIEQVAIRTLLKRQVDGLILVGGTLSGKMLAELAEKKPCIVVAQKLDGWEERCVTIDNVDAAFRATNFLVQHGHTAIAHFTGLIEHDDAKDRLEGYKKALKAAGIPLNPDWIFQGDFACQSGEIGVETLLNKAVDFTAIFAANDQMAMGARLALYRRGIRVPEEVSIMGFDDQPASAYLSPPLTTVVQPATEMGRTAARMLLQLLEGEPLEAANLKAEIVVRESVCRRP